MINLIEIQGQIEKLQKQASEIKAREFDKVVEEILVKMMAFGITLKNLQTRKTQKARATYKTATKAQGVIGKVKRKGEKAAGVVPAKYRGPNGETWSGRGLTPRWLAALLTEGLTKEEFIIKS